MKRSLIAALVAGLVFSGLSAAEAKKAKPVATSLYLHGATPIVGENDSFSLVNEAFLPMDKNEPTAAEPRSRWITNYLAGPNSQCAGNNLFPVWSGALAGTIKGDVKLTFNTIGTPGDVVVRIWPDVGQGSSLCDTENPAAPADSYLDPAGEVVVSLPPGPGTVEAVMKNVNFKALGSVVIQISPVVAVDLPSPGGAVLTPMFSRVLYDTPDFASVLEFSCIPASGTECTP
jgi:hypothetical protein